MGSHQECHTIMIFKQHFNIRSTKIQQHYNHQRDTGWWEGLKKSSSLDLEAIDEIVNPPWIFSTPWDQRYFVPRSAEPSNYVLGACLVVQVSKIFSKTFVATQDARLSAAPPPDSFPGTSFPLGDCMKTSVALAKRIFITSPPWRPSVGIIITQHLIHATHMSRGVTNNISMNSNLWRYMIQRTEEDSL